MRNKQGTPVDPIFVGAQIPDNQSREFINRNQFVIEYFSFYLSGGNPLVANVMLCA
jgi:hypothetical protein